MLLGGQFSSQTLGSPYSGSLFGLLKSGGQSTAELQGEPSEVCRGSKFAACRPGLLPRADDTSAAPVIPHVTTIESDPGVSPSFLISRLRSLFLISFPLCKLHRQLVKNSIYSYRSSIASSGFCAYPVRSPVHNVFFLSSETSGSLRLPVTVHCRCVQTSSSEGAVPILHHEAQCLPWVF